MDEFDRASELEQRFRDEAIRRARERGPVGEAAQRCDLCGERIPAGRRRAVQGVRLCVPCQNRTERMRLR